MALTLGAAVAVQVYDCEGERTTYEVIDLTETEECPDPEIDYEPTRTRQIQVVHKAEAKRIRGVQCKVTVTKMVTTCDSISHKIYGTQIPVWRQAHIIDERACRTAMTTGKYKHQWKTFDVEPGVRHSLSFFSVGGTDKYGYCYGPKTFITAGIDFQYAYEQTLLEVYIGKIAGVAHETDGTVRFRELEADYEDGTVADAFEGRIYWEVQEADCTGTTSQVYLGPAQLHARKERNGLKDAIVMVQQEETQQYAGFLLQGPRGHCGRPCHKTQVKGLVVCLLQDEEGANQGHKFQPQAWADLAAANLQTQIGFLHLDTNQRMLDRFEAMADDLCEVDRRAWRTKLHALAGTDNPYALLENYGKGYTIQVAGAAAYVTRCEPREATRVDFQNCTLEVPVQLDGKTRFADPLTWIIKDFPTVIPCSSVMPVRWKIQDKWYCSGPNVHPCVAPKKLGSVLEQTPAGDFTLGLGRGIFTDSQLAQHQAFWRSSSSRRAVLSKASNAASHGSNGRLGLLVSSSDMGGLALNIGSYLFPLLPMLGHFWSTFSGVMLALVVAKTVVECTIRMVAIYLQRGCGFWVLLGLWNVTFQTIHAPAGLVKAVVQKVKEKFDPLALPDLPTGEADHQDQDDDDPKGGPTELTTVVLSQPQGTSEEGAPKTPSRSTPLQSPPTTTPSAPPYSGPYRAARQGLETAQITQMDGAESHDSTANASHTTTMEGSPGEDSRFSDAPEGRYLESIL